MEKKKSLPTEYLTLKKNILADYEIAVISRKASIAGRKEVLSGKAKFGIFSDGKELPQIALSKVFRPGDFRSGYYRDQTLMMALGLYDTYSLFSGLYANTNLKKEPILVVDKWSDISPLNC